MNGKLSSVPLLSLRTDNFADPQYALFPPPNLGFFNDCVRRTFMFRRAFSPTLELSVLTQEFTPPRNYVLPKFEIKLTFAVTDNITTSNKYGNTTFVRMNPSLFCIFHSPPNYPSKDTSGNFAQYNQSPSAQ